MNPGSFFVASYETERLKTLSVWSCFADTGGLFQNHAPTIYRYASLGALLTGEDAGGEWPPLPGPGPASLLSHRKDIARAIPRTMRARGLLEISRRASCGIVAGRRPQNDPRPQRPGPPLLAAMGMARPPAGRARLAAFKAKRHGDRYAGFKAIVELAAKVLRVVWGVWRSGTPYDPLRTGGLQRQPR